MCLANVCRVCVCACVCVCVCSQLKKILSANPEAPLNIECIMDDKDVRVSHNTHIHKYSLKSVRAGTLRRALRDASISHDCPAQPCGAYTLARV